METGIQRACLGGSYPPPCAAASPPMGPIPTCYRASLRGSCLCVRCCHCLSSGSARLTQQESSKWPPPPSGFSPTVTPSTHTDHTSRETRLRFPAVCPETESPLSRGVPVLVTTMARPINPESICAWTLRRCPLKEPARTSKFLGLRPLGVGGPALLRVPPSSSSLSPCGQSQHLTAVLYCFRSCVFSRFITSA